MNVEITGRHVVITPAIRAYVIKRLQKVIKVLGDDISVHVIIDVEKERQSAEILLKSKSMSLAGKSRTDDMYASIVKAVEKIERQVLKHKGKVVERKRHRAKEESVAQRSGTAEESAPPENEDADRVREEKLKGKPMTVEEAILELNRSEYPFVAFMNSESGTVNVLYRRKDDTYRLIRT